MMMSEQVVLVGPITHSQCNMSQLSLGCKRPIVNQETSGILANKEYPEGPSTQIVGFQGPTTSQGMAFGT